METSNMAMAFFNVTLLLVCLVKHFLVVVSDQSHINARILNDFLNRQAIPNLKI